MDRPSKWRRTNAVLSIADSPARAERTARSISWLRAIRSGPGSEDRKGLVLAGRALGPVLVAGAVPLLPAGEVQGRVHRDPVEPGAELGAGVEAAERSIRPQERLLDRVLGALLVAGDAPGEPEQPRAVAHHQLPESLGVSLSGSFHQHGLVAFHSILLDAASGERLAPIGLSPGKPIAAPARLRRRNRREPACNQSAGSTYYPSSNVGFRAGGMMNGRWRVVASVLLALASPLAARQQATAPARSERPAYRVERATSPITIDGVLDEAAWQDAAVVDVKYETRPKENLPPDVKTETLLTYDGNHLYVGFRAHDPEPSAIRAHLLDRDRAFSDDFVGIVLDTFNDERRAFEFFVNPLGVQMDMFQDDVGGTEDDTWDAIWLSAGKINATGYAVEIAIPWSSLRFPRAEGEQTWGFDALRFYPRSQRARISSHPLDRNISCYLCQASKMTGFSGVTPGKNIEVAPTATAARTDRRSDFPDGAYEEGDVESDLGLTVKWGITPNLTLNAAVNPDFSQVEADSAQLDVNNQFALFFPEKRPFFLEGADFFDTPFDAVFTRNVADPAWGVKLTGKEGKNGLGVFASRDDRTNLLIPGSNGSAATSLDFETSDAVLRYRRDFGSSSALGVLYTGREGDGYQNHLAGIDGRYLFRGTSSFRGQFLRSRTEYPGSVREISTSRPELWRMTPTGSPTITTPAIGSAMRATRTSDGTSAPTWASCRGSTTSSRWPGSGTSGTATGGGGRAPASAGTGIAARTRTGSSSRRSSRSSPTSTVPGSRTSSSMSASASDSSTA